MKNLRIALDRVKLRTMDDHMRGIFLLNEISFGLVTWLLVHLIAYLNLSCILDKMHFKWLFIGISWNISVWTGVSESVAGDVLLMNKIDEHWKVPTDAIWR